MLAANGVSGLKTIALRPFSIYGEGEKLIVEAALKTKQMMYGTKYISLCYVGNMVEWELLAEKSLDEKPKVTAGQAYFVSDEKTQVDTRISLNKLLIEALKLEGWKHVNAPAFRVLCVIVPIADWLTCGKLEGPIMQLGAGSASFSLDEARLDISKGIRDLGYAMKYSQQDIRRILASHYEIK